VKARGPLPLPRFRPLRGLDPALRRARLMAARRYPAGFSARRGILNGHWDGGEVVRSHWPTEGRPPLPLAARPRSSRRARARTAAGAQRLARRSSGGAPRPPAGAG
jgi:hypothetical protein